MNATWSLNGKVSIVIPCFNRGNMLRETLDSIERSRNASLAEVVIVNDGSTDPETCRYLRELAESSYRVIHQPNRGLGSARNAGIQSAQGEFILPLDNDNRIREAYLARGVGMLLKHPEVGVVYGDAEYFGEMTGRWQVADFDLRRLVTRNYIDACALYRKSVWGAVDGYDDKMRIGFEDWDFWMRVALHGWKFMHLDEIAFDYRVHTGSMIGNTNRHSLDLISYIFGKAENRPLRVLRDRVLLEQLEMNLLRLIRGFAIAPSFESGIGVLTTLRRSTMHRNLFREGINAAIKRELDCLRIVAKVLKSIRE